MTALAIATLDDGRRYRVLEEVTSFCPLGLRFWDAAADEQIRAGLRVRAWPERAQRPVIEAFRTRSDVYAFQSLPGLAALERPSAPEGETGSPSGASASPSPSRPFIVEVLDARGHFLPAVFRVELPLAERGVYLAQPLAASPPLASPPGFYLFSAVARPRRPGIAIVRGELVDAASGEPAAHAVVRVEIAGQPERVGLAGADGRFAVHFPLPPLPGGLGPLFTSPDMPPSPPESPVVERRWEVEVRVAWEPGALSPLPGSALPDYRQVLLQAPAQVLLAGGVPASFWTGTLGYDGEVVIRTAGDPRLAVIPAGSPP